MDNRERFLNKPLTPEQLDAKFDEGYWDYLDSPQFREAFISPIAVWINRVCDQNNQKGRAVLDVGCGNGGLTDYLGKGIWYCGVDGSEKLVKRNNEIRSARGEKIFLNHCISTPSKFCSWRPVRFIVFGGVLEVLIIPEQRLAFVEMYLRYFRAEYVIIYDLLRLNLDEFTKENGFELVHSFQGRADVPDLQEEKKHRKVVIYKCA